MSEREGCGDELCSDGAPDFIPPRVSRGRRSGVILPGGGGGGGGGGGSQDTDTILLETVKAAPRRSSIIKDPSVQKMGGSRKKTVSFSSMPSEKKVSSAADCLAFMQGGCELKKVRPNSRVYCRFYTLDSDLSCLRWEPSKKDADRARLDVSGIREVRIGKSTETFLHNGPISEQLAEEAAFSIIHGDDYQSLDLVALSADVANIWVTGLRYLVAHPSIIGGAGGSGGLGVGGLGDGGGLCVEGSLGSKMRSEWLEAEFARVDEDGYGIVSEDTAVATICKLCPGIKEAKVRLRFKEIQRSKEKLTSHVTREEFQEAYCELCTRPDVYFLLVQLSKDRECLDPQDLRLFLETEQGLSLATAEGCWELLRRHEPSAQGRERGLLGLDGFARYLQSPECQLLDPEHLGVCQDMNMPLSHYYISTSYRSYLLDDQVHGRADLGGLMKALQSGCRCIELGVTDGPEGEPLLGVDYGPDISRHHHHHHHHHHHAPVTIRSALEVVNKYAFLTSQYPLLVYLCQRCTPAQQRTMAHHLKKAFGSRLYTPESLPVSLGGRATTLPSPEQLKGRVLLVGKKLPPEQDGSDGEVSEEDEEIGGGGPLAGRRMTIPGEEELGVVLVVPPPSQPRKLRLHKELSDLVAIARTGSRSFYAQRTSHKQAPQQSPPGSPASPGTPMPPEVPYWTLCSLGEGEAGRLTSESPEDLVMFTKRTLTRVRPSSVRLDSSNPNPQGYWKGGVQLVALNQQTPGAMLDLHRGRFSHNGSCGYILRPAVMRDEVSYFSAHTQGCVPGVPPQTLRIKVISAHNLPKPQGSGAKGEVIDPYVVLELHGVPADCAEQRTRTAAQNQDDPLFDETFEFQVNMPELALLRFVVLDDDYIGDDFIGQYSVAFECLQPGYRNVPLLGLAGDPLPHTSLFVHVAVTNRRGGGKAQRRGLSVRRVGRRGREYVTLRHTGIKAMDETFKSAGSPLKEATDLREDAQVSHSRSSEHHRRLQGAVWAPYCGQTEAVHPEPGHQAAGHRRRHGGHHGAEGRLPVSGGPGQPLGPHAETARRLRHDDHSPETADRERRLCSGEDRPGAARRDGLPRGPLPARGEGGAEGTQAEQGRGEFHLEHHGAEGSERSVTRSQDGLPGRPEAAGSGLRSLRTHLLHLLLQPLVHLLHRRAALLLPPAVRPPQQHTRQRTHLNLLRLLLLFLLLLLLVQHTAREEENCARSRERKKERKTGVGGASLLFRVCRSLTVSSSVVSDVCRKLFGRCVRRRGCIGCSTRGLWTSGGSR